jgi:hypothetical protein
MKHVTKISCIVAISAGIGTLSAAFANDITTEWASVKPPPIPQLKTVTVDPKTTALLVLDFMKANCGVRPRCINTVPNVKKLIDEARAHDMMIAYTLVG